MDHRTPGAIKQDVRPILSRSYDSGSQTISSAGGITLAHGLGEIPKLVNITLRCLSATGPAGYSQNDELESGVQLSPSYDHADGGTAGVSIKKDATNITLRYVSGVTSLTIPHATTGANTGSAIANWALVVRAYA